jgi:ribosomal protein L3 glutamine methyltransferase
LKIVATTPKKPKSSRAKPVAKKKDVRPVTLGDWLKHAIARYRKTGVALGQVATNAHDEALYLLLRTLALPLDSDPSVLDRKLKAAEVMSVENMLERRLEQRIPAAYLTREAFLGEYRFYVDERVIIPRSYFLEIIPQQLDAWLPAPGKVKHVVDVCTGSGCLAILLAHHFPKAKVDAVDLSPDALDVARINIKNHRLARRVKLHESDVFDAVPKVKYDVILSNPPYEPSAYCDKLPAEFHSEPRMALDGGEDGLDIIRKLLRQARSRLQPHGVVLIEVGGLQRAMDKEFAALDLYWMHTADGSNCVCLIQAARLKAWKG